LIEINDAYSTLGYPFGQEQEGAVMSEQTDLEYFAARAATERQLSDTASEPSIALIHAQLADRYELLATGWDQQHPFLHVVGQS
jgi:hypothetical protein